MLKAKIGIKKSLISGKSLRKNGVCGGCREKFNLDDLHTIVFDVGRRLIESHKSPHHYCMSCLKLLQKTINDYVEDEEMLEVK